MTWTSADYRSYPARCLRLHLEASATLEPILVGSWLSHYEAKSEATLLRQFRFLIRSNPGLDFSCDRLMTSNDFRTSIKTNPAGDALLYLLCRPKPEALIDLNPDLADILAG